MGTRADRARGAGRRWNRGHGHGSAEALPFNAKPSEQRGVALSTASAQTRPEPRDCPGEPAALSVCNVWDSDYPWDVRVEKISLALTEAGHRVNLVARNRGRLAVKETLPEAHVHRLAPWRWLPSSIDAAAMFPAFFNPRWLKTIYAVARSEGAHLILCRDLPLAPTSIIAARALDIPVVFDMAENYPAMLASRQSSGRLRPFDVVVRNPTLARRIEQWVLPRVDGILVVVEESKERLVREGVPDENVVIVGNTPPLQRLQGATADHNSGADPLQVIYLGNVEFQRGLGTALEAVAALNASEFPVRLTIIGGGLDDTLLRTRAKELGLDDRQAVFRGKVNHVDALTELPLAHVGIVPHWKDELWDTTIPNKLFDYMAAGLAVVTSDAAPAARIVETSRCGLVFHDRDPVGLANALRDLADPAIRRQMGADGRTAIRSRFHWELDAARLLAFLGAAIERRRAKRLSTFDRRSKTRSSPALSTREDSTHDAGGA
jgi:glycosyltransferase involved in cell wall biosynthesis